jgi:hypothetical protein
MTGPHAVYWLRGAAGMVGDEVHDPALRMVAVRRLLVQRGLHPSGPRELQQWSMKEIAHRAVDDLPVDSVVVVAVCSEERRREVENALALYYQWGVQWLAHRRLGVAREVLPRPVEERATQLPVRLGTFEWTNQVGPVVEYVVVVCG